MTARPPVEASSVAIDPENPWLGLFSYSEETRAYFHGRDEETGELARRVQRKLLTVLFGQSGLGKTSLLRAGLVPRLRAEGFCPVYVRVDYAPDSPSPAEQIKRAIFRASSEAGSWSRPGASIPGETLWEFMHHRGDLLRDADGRTLVPLLIFDQFEEIFTLAQADDAGRRRAHQFLDELADLVENRPPAALEARLEDDDAAAEDFDFARADYRILIALREDYLAHLESVKSAMPSITQNRMRLARMTGAEALSAVVKPGGKLVSQEVAESIVRFVAGGAELANAEIEPSLLSLICRELNTVRIAQGRAEISADLLAGSRDSILSEFYERTLADQPPAVRRVIEDELLTESGYRESLAEERVAKALAAAGAAPDALAALVDRRLLRIEERLDMRRVELTHDVLCSVVLSSRDKRHDREARELAQRQRAEQEAREANSHRALVRARMIATVCSVLMLISVASAVFGWINLQRARAADAAAQKSRGDAEKLVGFLIEDFYADLQPTGQLDTLGKLAHMTVAYYDGLPPALRTPRTQTYRAMALIREGTAQSGKGDTDAAYAKFDEAQQVFERLRAAGNLSEPVTYGLALSLFNQGNGVLGGSRGTANELKQAADLLRPAVRESNASRRVQKLYADILNVYSHTLPKVEGVAACEDARKVLLGLGALDLSDLDAAAAYADTTDSQARHLLKLGRVDEAQKLEEEVYAMAEKVLAQRPGDLRSMTNRYFAADLLAALATRRHDDATAADYAQRSARAGESYMLFQPSDIAAWGLWTRGLDSVADYQQDRGEISQSIATRRSSVALAKDSRRPASLGPIIFTQWIRLALLERQAGQTAASEQSLQAGVTASKELLAQFAADDVRRKIVAEAETVARSRMHLIDGRARAALETASQVIARVEKVHTVAGDNNGIRTKHNVLRSQYATASAAALLLGEYAQAEALARKRLAIPPDNTTDEDPLDEESAARSVVANALAMQGRGTDALKMLEPGLAYYRREQAANAHGIFFRYEFAYALYASALAHGSDPAGRAIRDAELTEAKTLIEGTSGETQRLSNYRLLAAKIASARAS